MSDLTPTVQSEWDRFVQDIKLGVYDGHLQDVMTAIQFRAAGGATAFRWRITIDDIEITEDNVTLGELVDIEKALDVSWVSISPARSAQQCVEIMRAGLSHRTDKSPEDVGELVDKMSADEALDAIDQYELRRPPLEQDTPSTT